MIVKKNNLQPDMFQNFFLVICTDPEYNLEYDTEVRSEWAEHSTWALGLQTLQAVMICSVLSINGREGFHREKLKVLWDSSTSRNGKKVHDPWEGNVRLEFCIWPWFCQAHRTALNNLHCKRALSSVEEFIRQHHHETRANHHNQSPRFTGSYLWIYLLHWNLFVTPKSII